MKWIAAGILVALVAPGEIRIGVHGHRGARAVLPENTVPAFEYAIQAGADVLELDVAVTKDNVLVVSHDPELAKPVCSGPRDRAVIRELTLEQVRAYDCGAIPNPRFPRQRPVPGTRMPSLDEVFDLASRASFSFNVETKIFPDKPQLTPSPEEFSRLLLEAIRRHRLEKRVIVQSFDYRTLAAVKQLAPEIRLSALYENGPRDFVDIAKEAGASIVSPEYDCVTAAKVRAAHSAGLQVVPWTVNKPEDWQRMVNANVDAIITDDPAALIAWLKSKKLR